MYRIQSLAQKLQSPSQMPQCLLRSVTNSSREMVMQYHPCWTRQPRSLGLGLKAYGLLEGFGRSGWTLVPL